MSARAWLARRARRDHPALLVILDDGTDRARVLRSRRIEWARERRLESLRRRQTRRGHRSPWRYVGQIDLPWSFPGATVLGDVQTLSGGRWPLLAHGVYVAPLGSPPPTVAELEAGRGLFP